MTNKDAAKKLLKLFGSKGQRFGTGSVAQDKKGKCVSTDDPTAVRWCVYGGLLKLGLYESRFERRFHILAKNLNNLGIGTWNDKVGWFGVRKTLLGAAKTGRIRLFSGASK